LLVSFMAFWRGILTVFCLAASAPLYGQAITINPATLDAPLRTKIINERAFFVNGIFTQGLTPNIAATLYRLGPMSRTLVTLTALRMNAAGLLNLDEDIARTLPDLLDENPFRVAITPRHLLTETAGFAVPPVFWPDTPFQNYLTQIRTAGQMTHTDSVGWKLLVFFLEAKGDATLSELISQHVLNDLGDAEYQVHFPPASAQLDQLGVIKANGNLIADIARLSVRNRDKDGIRFLPTDLYKQFVARQNWRMHPIGPRRTLGGVMQDLGERTYISPPTVQGDGDGVTFTAFPDQGITFIYMGKPTQAYFKAIKSIARGYFLPAATDLRLNEARGLHDKDIRFNGNYVRSDTPSAWLKNRLTALESNTLSLSDRGSGTVSVRLNSGELRLYQKKAPYLYETLPEERMILSPYRQGGYLVLDDIIYRYVGILGNKVFVLDIFPLVILVLLSSVIYIRSTVSPRWRKMALFGTLGTLMVGAALAAEYYLWPKAILIWDIPWLVNLWRIILNAGLALVLSVPLFAMSFTRKNEMPQNAAIFTAPLHLALLSISALALFLILIAWGVAGEFSAF